WGQRHALRRVLQGRRYTTALSGITERVSSTRSGTTREGDTRGHPSGTWLASPHTGRVSRQSPQKPAGGGRMKALFATFPVIAIPGAFVVGPVMAQAKTIEGKVMAVDPGGKSVTRDDGTKLSITAPTKFKTADLKPGAAVKAAYEEKDGQK